MATFAPNRMPIIVVDKDNLPKFSPIFQKFTLEHECAHHRLGHVELGETLEKTGNFTGTEYFERDADCSAIKNLYREGTSDEQFKQLFSDMTNRKLIEPAITGIRPTEYAAVAHNWTLEERVEHARTCLSEVKRGE